MQINRKMGFITPVIRGVPVWEHSAASGPLGRISHQFCSCGFHQLIMLAVEMMTIVSCLKDFSEHSIVGLVVSTSLWLWREAEMALPLVLTFVKHRGLTEHPFILLVQRHWCAELFPGEIPHSHSCMWLQERKVTATFLSSPCSEFSHRIFSKLRIGDILKILEKVISQHFKTSLFYLCKLFFIIY